MNNNTVFYSYVAGFLDGDGSIYVRLKPNSTYRYGFQIAPSVVFYQKSSGALVLRVIQKKLKFGYLRTRNDGIVEYIIGDKTSIITLLTQVIPFLILKRKQARLMLRIFKKIELISTARKFLQVAELIDQFEKLNYSKKRTIHAQMVRDHLVFKGLITP